jgi:glycosyltransferase involved in cell wall biosynthesis
VRRVLVLAYYFPPIGGGGVQRTLKFCRYLPELGWDPVVVTGPGTTDDLWAPGDRTLLEQLGSEIEVHRIHTPEPAVPRWRGRVDRALDRLPPTLRWWVEGAVDVGRQAGRDVDLVFGELVPYATAYAARRLAMETGRPWVADLQDPWALDEMWLYPTGWHRARDSRRMRRALGSAAAVIMNTPEAAARVRRAFPELSQRVVEAIPNGFDSGDFVDVPSAARQPGVFRIVHTGTMHTEAGLQLRSRKRLRRALGGMPVPEVDFLTRSHVYLLEAVERLVEQEAVRPGEVEVHLAGALTETDRATAATSAAVRLHEYISHSETIGLMLSADLLFLPMHELPEGTRAGLVPGKTYEYLGSGRPILGAVPAGDARELLAAAGNALLCGPSDVTRMAELLAARIVQWRRGEAPPAPDASVIEPYERRRQTERLAAVLDGALLQRTGAEATPRAPRGAAHGSAA